MWEQIRELTLKSIAPAKIYEEGDLIKRSIRDLYNREIDEVLVEGERGYRIAKDFMKMIMPSHAKNVKHYRSDAAFRAPPGGKLPLGMFNPTVQLKSGGYIVIGVTEALVAIDVNSGRATKEGSIEETALKTNLEAAEEVARQLRLRDLAGLIVIDFIDMDERRNNSAVEKRMKDKLKTDRARIQVGRISGFGLMEMSRQRLRPGMIEATTQPCQACHGTGLIRSDDNLALSILRQIEEEGTRRRSREVLVKCPVGIANFIMNQKREHVAQIEARYGLSVRIEGDPMLISPDFALEKFKTATRTVPDASAPVVSVNSSLMDDIDDDTTPEEEAEAPQAAPEDEENKPKKRRRRRRRRKPRTDAAGDDQSADAQDNASDTPKGDSAGEDGGQKSAPAEDAPAKDADASEPAADAATDAAAENDAAEEPKPKPKRTRKPRKKAAEPAPEAEAAPAETPEPVAEEPAPEAVEKPKKRRSRAKKKDPEAAEAPTAEPVAEPAMAEASAEPAAVIAEPVAEVAVADAPQAKPAPAPAPEPVAEKAPDPDKPKRKGWWSLGR